MQRLRVATSFVAGHCTTCRSEHVLVAIRFNATFLHLRPYCEKCAGYLFLERCKKSKNVWLRALMQWFLYSPFFEHYNYILLCDWVPGPYSVILWTYAGHNAFVRYQGQGWPKADATDAAGLGPAPLGPRAMVFG